MVYDSGRKQFKLSPDKRCEGQSPSPRDVHTWSFQLSPPSGGVDSVTAPNSDTCHSVHMGHCPPGKAPEPGFSVGLGHTYMRGGCPHGWAVPRPSGSWWAPRAPGVSAVLSTFQRWLLRVLGQLFPLVPIAASLERLQITSALLGGFYFCSDELPQEKRVPLWLCLVFLPCSRVCPVLGLWM